MARSGNTELFTRDALGLDEAVAVLRLIDHAEEADAMTLRTASRAARRLVGTVNDQLDELDIEIGREGVEAA